MSTNPVDSDAEWGAAAEETDSSEAHKKRRALWIWLEIGIVALLALTCVGGVFGLAALGLGIRRAEIEDELRANPALQAEIGTLEELETDWARSLREADRDIFVCRAKGSRGTGIVRVKSESGDDHERVLWAELELPSGEKRELPVSALPEPSEE